MPGRAVSRWLLAVVAGSMVGACYWITPYSDLTAVDGSDATIPVDAADELAAEGPDAEELDAGDAIAADDDAGDAQDASDLLAFWTFESDDGGIARDRSGNGYDLLLDEGATTAAPGHDGGSALQFPDGAGLAHNETLGPDFPPAGTLSWWALFLPSAATPGQPAIFDGYDPSRHHIYIRGETGDGAAETVDFASEISTGYEVYAYPAPVVATRRWTHLVMVWDRTASPKNYAYLYIDGQQAGGASFTPSEVPIAQKFAFANGYGGSYDDMYLWKRAFSEEEIREIP